MDTSTPWGSPSSAAETQAAIRDISNRAKALGYDPQSVIRRLAYGSFVSVPRRYMYVETPKAACTALKWLIVRIENAVFDEMAPPYQGETRRDMLIHQRRYVHIPTLLEIPGEMRTQILSGASDWFVFAVVRNPFSRLVSVFENKVRAGEPNYRNLTARYGDDGAFAGPKSAFAAFVREFVRDPARRRGDAHLNAQVDLLLPRIIPYRLFKLERIAEGLAAFGEHVARHGGPGALTLERMNATVGAPWRDFYDEASSHAVVEAYAGDFAAFGYDTQDWRGGRETIEETDGTRRWRAEVVERNALIARLYDQLSNPPPK